MLWDDFLNSHYHDWRGGGKSEDRLDKPGWLTEWISEHRLPNPGAPNAADVESLKLLRARMLRIVQEVTAVRPISGEDINELNSTLADGPFVNRLQSAGGQGLTVSTVPLRTDWPSIRAAIAASFARTLAEGEPARFRICDNPDCLWVYYDETRNRSKRYCDDKMCGNLMKVRRFRARKKAEQNQDT